MTTSMQAILDNESVMELDVVEDFPSDGFSEERGDLSLWNLAELILKNSKRLDRLARKDAWQVSLIPRLLALSLMSYSVFSCTLVLLLFVAPSSALPSFLREPWSRPGMGPGISLGLAYPLGLIAATGVCLPSFYFYSLLAGVKVSMLQVTTFIMKGMVSTAFMLMGILPIYFAVALGLLVFRADPLILQECICFGLGLPFLAGCWGVLSIHSSFTSLADTLPPQRRSSRCCFLRRLTISCTLCYTAVTPVMIYTLWQNFTRSLT